jgi:hypothetical protein
VCEGGVRKSWWTTVGKKVWMSEKDLEKVSENLTGKGRVKCVLVNVLEKKLDIGKAGANGKGHLRQVRERVASILYSHLPSNTSSKNTSRVDGFCIASSYHTIIECPRGRSFTDALMKTQRY